MVRTDVVSGVLVETLGAVGAVLNTDNLKATMVLIEVEAAAPAAIARDLLDAQGLR